MMNNTPQTDIPHPKEIVQNEPEIAGLFFRYGDNFCRCEITLSGEYTGLIGVQAVNRNEEVSVELTVKTDTSPEAVSHYIDYLREQHPAVTVEKVTEIYLDEDDPDQQFGIDEYDPDELPDSFECQQQFA